jgi:hypothetical protein
LNQLVKRLPVIAFTTAIFFWFPISFNKRKPYLQRYRRQAGQLQQEDAAHRQNFYQEEPLYSVTF